MLLLVSFNAMVSTHEILSSTYFRTLIHTLLLECVNTIYNKWTFLYFHTPWSPPRLQRWAINKINNLNLRTNKPKAWKQQRNTTDRTAHSDTTDPEDGLVTYAIGNIRGYDAAQH